MNIIPVVHSEINVYHELVDMQMTEEGLSADVLCVETTLNTYEERSTARVLIYARNRDNGIIALEAQSDVPEQHQKLMRDEIDAFMDSYKKQLLFMSFSVLASPIGHRL